MEISAEKSLYQKSELRLEEFQDQEYTLANNGKLKSETERIIVLYDVLQPSVGAPSRSIPAESLMQRAVGEDENDNYYKHYNRSIGLI